MEQEKSYAGSLNPHQKKKSSILSLLIIRMSPASGFYLLFNLKNCKITLVRTLRDNPFILFMIFK